MQQACHMQSDVEKLYDRWCGVPGAGKEFKDFSELQRAVQSLSTPLPAQMINSLILQFQPLITLGYEGQVVEEAEEKRFTGACRFILLLHFQLGKRAGFSLSDEALSVAVEALRACVSRGTLGSGPGIGGGGGGGLQSLKKKASTLKESKTQAKTCRELIQTAALLIAVHLASLSIGMEQVLSILYMNDAPPERKRYLLLVLHRVFRAEMLTTKKIHIDPTASPSMMGQGGGQEDSRQSLRSGRHGRMPVLAGGGGFSLIQTIHDDARRGIGCHPQVRLCSLAHARPVTMEEVILEQLLNADLSGEKSGLFGKAPQAVPLSSAIAAPGGGSSAKSTFSLLHFCESMSESQIQHGYLISAIRHYAQHQLELSRAGLGESAEPSSSTTTSKKKKKKTAKKKDSSEEEKKPKAAVAMTTDVAVFSDTGLSEDSLSLLATYVEVLFDQLDGYCTRSAKHVLFTSGKSLGLMYVEAVIVEAIHLAKIVATSTNAPEHLKGSMLSGVTMLFYNIIRTVRGNNARLPTSSEALELKEYELPLAVEFVEQQQMAPSGLASGGGGNPTRASSGPAPPPSGTNVYDEDDTDGVSPPGLRESIHLREDGGGFAQHTLHFGPEVVLECLEFLLHVAPVQEGLNYFQDLFTPTVWETLVREHSTFPLQLVLLLWRNRKRLRPVLPKVAPRVIWLLSRWPHTLLPVVRRLVPFLRHRSTENDLMLRLGLLPLVCFVADIDLKRPSAFETGLWDAIGDWSSVSLVIEGKLQQTKLEQFVTKNRHAFKAWDSVQRVVGNLSPRMMYCFRIVRPLLIEFSNCSGSKHLPSKFFDTIAFLYFFGIYPIDARSVLTNTLLDLGRWAAESEPGLAVRSSEVFMDAIRQQFIPDAESTKRSKEMMRWASVVLSTALFSLRNDEARKRAAEAFDVVELETLELLAMDLQSEAAQLKAKEQQNQATLLSTVGSALGGGSADSEHSGSSGVGDGGYESVIYGAGGGGGSGAGPRDGGGSNNYIGSGAGSVQTGGEPWSITVPLGAAVSAKDYVDPNRVVGVVPDTLDGGGAGDGDSSSRGNEAGATAASTGGGGVILWHQISSSVWHSRASIHLTGIQLTEQLHSMVMTVTQLARCSFSLKERCLILLNKVIRSVKSDGAGVSILATATMCVKLLLLPIVDAGTGDKAGLGGSTGSSGGGAMPLYSLLGVPPSTG